MLDIIYRLTSRLMMDLLWLFGKMLPIRGHVLMFHNVGNSNGELNLDIPVFEALVEKLVVEGKSRFIESTGFCILTFDDVMESFYTNAYPILKSKQCPFTLFVSLELLDQPGYITTEQLKELATDPLCTIGSHGMKHTYFSKYTFAESRKDMEDSKFRLGELTGREITLFAFPYGSFYASGYKAKKQVMKLFEYGFSTVSSPVTKPSLCYRGFLPRINVDNNTINTLKI